jgi:peptide/nickel transport system permease protein
MAAMAAETLTLRSVASQGQAGIVFRQLRRNYAAVAGAIILALEVILAVGAPVFAPYSPIEQDFSVALQGPTHAHLFGTDDVGRDLLSRVIHGARISLSVGLISVGIGSVIGVILGVIAGFYGGIIDTLLLRFMDVLLAFPGILLALAVVAVLGPGLYNVMIAVGLGGIPAYTRLARASTLSVRERDYVLAARAIGCPNGRLMGRYILPNVVPPVIVLATLVIAGAILTAAGLSFIGVGAQPPSPEWGAMLSLGRQYLQRAWWVTIFPGLAIMLTVLSVNMVGDALRDALDPKLRR